jgi:hypothetical protein
LPLYGELLIFDTNQQFATHRIKGVRETVKVFEVTGLGLLRTRLQRSAVRGYTKFVSRQREMEAMKHAAEQAKVRQDRCAMCSWTDPRKMAKPNGHRISLRQ